MSDEETVSDPVEETVAMLKDVLDKSQEMWSEIYNKLLVAGHPQEVAMRVALELTPKPVDVVRLILETATVNLEDLENLGGGGNDQSG